MVTSVGNAATVVTNANLTGMVTSVGNATSLGSFTSAQLATALTDETGSGSAVFSASPTLTGTPIAPTAATNTSTTQIATTAFANPGASLAANGYQRLPSGLIMQWGLNNTPAGANNVIVNFPIAFASAVYSVTGNAVGFAGYNGDQVQFNAVNTSNFRAYTTTASVAFYWFAIGK